MADDENVVDYSPSIDSFIHNVGVFLFLLAFLMAYVRRVNKMPPSEGDNSKYASFARWFVLGRENIISTTGGSAKQSNDPSFFASALALSGCAVGLQVSYLTWGVLQERLITLDYDGEKFKSSQFLVFTNRAIAFCVAVAINRYGAKPTQFAPFYKFSFASFSNILSSWCQYEALKYVSFPTQVVSKSSKLIPVMIVGKILANKKYELYEYGVAVVISLGVIIFTLSQEVEGDTDGKSTVVGGIVLCLGYMCFDSFTSQWQGLVFKTYKVTPYQMMFGVNAFSASFTFISLIINAELLYCFGFIAQHPSCVVHIVMLSLCGATGQLFIFYTIKRFGPLVFTIIMTTRQLISIALSCIIYSHPIAAQGYVGAAIVFGALIYKIKRKFDKSKASAKPVAYSKVSQDAKGTSDGRVTAIGEDEVELGEFQGNQQDPTK